MPLQNRVFPTGAIQSISDRGTLMGNRGGRFHDPATRKLHPTRRWASKQWITCVLKFKGRHRQVMGQSYTELFFMDEVTAMAAGHRPCFECRRQAAVAFAEAWQRSSGDLERPKAGEMDKILHGERLDGRDRRRSRMKREALPDGAMFAHQEQIFVQRAGQIFTWSAQGYNIAHTDLPTGVDVLTPPAIINCLAAGYQPLWHSTSNS